MFKHLKGKERLNMFHYPFKNVNLKDKYPQFDLIGFAHTEQALSYKIISHLISEDKKSYILHSSKIDSYIQLNTLTFCEDIEKKKTIIHQIEKNNGNLLFLHFNYKKALASKKMFFNADKFCLSQDIVPRHDLKVFCHNGSYYDTYLTNIIAGKQLLLNNKIIADATNMFPIQTGEGVSFFKSISESNLNNEIGVSTLGITLDNYLILRTQLNSAQSSSNLLIPTGSGSCDWADIQGEDFTSTITTAMQRELWEENIDTHVCSNSSVGTTKLLGYFRWVEKGCKPEFVGITKLNVNLEDLAKTTLEVGRVSSYTIHTLAELRTTLEMLLVKDLVSTPLYMNILILLNYLKNNETELSNFLNI